MVIKVLLAEDHGIVREGLRAILQREGFEIVGEASDGMEAVALARDSQPHVAVLDFDMPHMNGITAAQELARISPRTRTLLLTMYADRQYVLGALRAGIHGFVIKSQASADLVQAIRIVHEGKPYLSPGISATVVEAFTSPGEAPDPVLTPRERQVLQLVAEGHTSKAIAVKLGLSVKTVESYRARVMEKVGVHETAGLVRYAIRNGVIVP